MKKLLLLELLTVMYIALIWVISSIPNDEITGIEMGLTGTSIPKLVYHFAEFAVLGVLLGAGIETGHIIAISGHPSSRSQNYEVAAVFGVAFSFIDEVHQYFVPNRVCALDDAVVNVLGFMAGILMVLMLTLLIRRRRKAKKQ